MLNDSLQNLGPAGLRDVDAERVDTRLALIRGRAERDRERALPVIYGFDRTVEVTTGFHPLDFISAVAGRKYRFDIDGYGIRLGALEGWICPVVLADKRLRMTAARNMRVYTINGFPLRNGVRGNQPKILNPAEQLSTLQPIVAHGSLIGQPGCKRPTEAIHQDNKW